MSAQHFRDDERARGAAHAFAAQGHMLNARETLDEAARLHASKSTTQT